MKRRGLSDESGAVVIEATYIFFLITLLVALLLGFMLITFQKYQLQVIANETAARVGRIYPYVDVDPKTQRVSEADIDKSVRVFSGSGLYRNFFNNSGQKNTNEVRAEEFSAYALENMSMLTPVSHEIDAQVFDDTFAMRHIEVTVTATYDVPMGGIFRFFGMSDTITYTATGRAQCVDMVDYINAVSYARFVEKEFMSLPIIGDLLKIIDNLTSLFGG